jgi:hypothetical protein
VVEFTETLRQRCRKCKGKLPTPTGNDREAFCCRGCYEQFYRQRCRVCECEIEQPKTGGNPRLTCKQPKCKYAWHQKVGFGRFLVAKSQTPSPAASNEQPASETSIKSSLKSRLKRGRATDADWREPLRSYRSGRIVAGRSLSRGAFHAAIVPDGPDCRWAGSAYERAEARNTAAPPFEKQKRTPEEKQRREREYVALVRACDDWRMGGAYPAGYGVNPKLTPAWKRVTGEQPATTKIGVGCTTTVASPIDGIPSVW